MISKLGWSLALAGVLGLAASAVQAESLTLDQAVRRALAGNAGLKAEGAAIAAAEHQRDADSLGPPLTFGGELENVAGTGAVSGIRGAETTLRLGRVFELGDKQQARRALGEASIAQQRNQAEQRRLDVAAEVTRRYIDVVAKQETLALTGRSVALLKLNRDAVARRVERGRSPVSDLHLAELSVIRAELAQEDATHELASARVTLAVLWGQAAPDFDDVTGNLDELPVVADLGDLTKRLDLTPDRRALQLEAERISAQRRVAESSRQPDLHATLGVRRFEAIDDQALVFSLSLPLGTTTRAAPAISKQNAELERLDAESREQSLDAYQKLFGRYQELQHARHQVEALHEQMIPRAEQAPAATEQGYEESRFSFLQVAQARTVLLDLQRDAINAAARYHRLLADIERATAVSGDTQ